MGVAAIAFDTHRFVKRLTTAGMGERQAEILADEQARLLNTNLATKTELAATEAWLLKWMVSVRQPPHRNNLSGRQVAGYLSDSPAARQSLHGHSQPHMLRRAL